MKTLNIITFFILLFIFNLIFVSCLQKKEQIIKPTSKINECGCNLSDLEIDEKFPIYSKNDSIIICKTGDINGMNWTDFLSKNVLNDYFPIYNCQTGKNITGKLSSISVKYEEKSLILFSNYEFIVYDTIKEEFFESLEINVYKEKIFALNNQIHKSEPEFILTPPLLNKKALYQIDKIYELKLRKPNNNSSWRLVNYLFVGALNGDKKSKERLLNFQKNIPSRFDGDEDNNPSNLALSIEILKDFENHKLNNKIEYLNLKKYPKFQ